MRLRVYLQWVAAEDPPSNCPAGRYYFDTLYWFDRTLEYRVTWTIHGPSRQWDKTEADILCGIWAEMTFRHDPWKLVIERVT